MYTVPFPSEKFIEDYVAACLDDGELCPVSGSNVSFHLRQHEIRGYGISDLVKVCVYDWGEKPVVYVTVLELKNENLKEAHISQLARYMTGLRRQLARYRKIGIDVRVLGELAGPFDLKNAGDILFLLEALKDINLYALTLSMGCGFNSSPVAKGWHNSSEDLLGARPAIRKMMDGGHFLACHWPRPKPKKKPAAVVRINGGFD